MTSYRFLHRIFIAGLFAVLVIRTFAAPNAAPVNSVPGAQATDEDTPLVFSAGNGNQIQISDPDAGSGTMAISLAVTHGTLTFAGTSGLSFVLGTGTGDEVMTFTGTTTNVNSALASLTYTPSADFSGSATLTLVTNDQGNTGTGGALSDTDAISITVNPINDAPVAHDDLASTAPGVPIDVDVKGNDRDVDNVLADLTVTILSNSPGTSASVNPDGTINFDPGATSSSQTVTYNLTDPDGLVSNTATLTNNVAANNLPAGSDASATMEQDDGYDFQLSDFSFGDADGGDTLFAVRIDTLPAQGLMTLSGYAVNAGQSVLTADLFNLRFTPTATGSGTPYTFFAFSVQDSKGGYDSTPNTFVLNVVDTTPPTTTIASVAFSADTGTSASDFITKTAAQTISGTLSTNLAAGEIVQVSLDNGTTWTTATATVGSNTWSLSGRTLTGSNTLKARVTDDANNFGTALSQVYVLDTTAPTISIGAASTAGTGSGPVNFTVTYADARFNASTLSSGDITLDATGNANATLGVTGSGATRTVTLSSITGDGTLAISIASGTATDVAGNSAASSGTSSTFTVDNTASTTTVATVAFSADTGSSASDFITSAAAQTISGTLSANLAAGEIVQVSLNNGTSWTTATASVGSNTWSLSGQTLSGGDTLKVRVTDAVGNASTALSQAYTVDTSAPTVASVVRTTPSTQIMRASSVVFTVTFSKAVTNVGTGSFVIVPVNGSTTTATVASVTGGPVVYQVTVNITGGAGDFRLDVGPVISTFATGFGNPNALVFDVAGNLYTADDGNGTVRKITSGGVVSTLASVSSPYGIAISAAGDLYLSSNGEVKKVTLGGAVSTFATGFNVAGGLAFDSAGNLYVGNYGNSTVSKVTSGGAVSTYLTGINAPFGLTFDASGNLYIASRDAGTISKVTTGGVVSTFATGFNGPHEMEFDAAGNLYVADRWNNRVAKVAPDGTVSTYANGVNAAYGLATDAAGALYVSSYIVDNIVRKITLPVINDLAGNAVTSLPYNTGETYTYDPNDAPTDITLSSALAVQPAGSGTTIGTLSSTDADLGDTHTYTLVSGSGSTDNASFAIAGNSLNVGASPLAAGSYSVRIQTDDGQGGTYAKALVIAVVDDVIPQITSIARKTPTAQATTHTTAVFEMTFSEAVTGVGTSWFTVTPINGSTITGNVVSVSGGPTVYEVTVAVTGGSGDFRLDVLAPSAPADFGPTLTSPWGLVFDGGGNLYVANNATNQVSKVAGDGTMTTYATAFSSPRGVAFDGAGNLYVANSSNSRVIKVATNGTKTNFATGVNAARGLAFDGAGNLYVSSFSGNTVSKVTSTGTKTTFASDLSGPTGLAFDSAGNLYVANYTDNTVIRVKPDGTKTTFATGFNNPEGLAFDATGNLYVTNYTGGTLVKIAAKGLTSTVATGLSSPTGLVFDSAGLLYVSVNGSNKVIRFDLATIDDLAGNALSGLPYASGDNYTYTPNSAPTDITLSHASVNQSGGTNATLGTLTTTDADSGDSQTYTLVTGTGDTDNASFNLSGSTLRANDASTLAAGNYSVRIQTDDGNGGTFQKAFALTVVDIPPVVTSVSVPTNASYAIGQAMDFVIHFTKNVTVDTTSGTPRLALTFNTGGTVYATYVSGSGTSALTFRYTIVAGTLDADGIVVGVLGLNGGTLSDGAGNNATLTLNGVGSTTGVLVDGQAPTVVSVVRTTPSTQIMRASSVVFTVTFSKAVMSVGTASFTIVPVNGSTTTPTVASVSGGPVVYQVTVNITGGAGDFRLDVGPQISTFAAGGLTQPNSMARDSAGNLYLSDEGNNTVEKITSGGVVSTFASIPSPYGIVISAAGDIYVASNTEVKKITPGGVVSTFASGFSVAGGLVFDSAGNLYVGNYLSSSVSKVTSGGVVSTYLTGIGSPLGLAVDASDNLYISNRDQGTVTKAITGGVVSTYATGFNSPQEVEFDAAGNLYVTDRLANRVAKVAPDGTVSTYANGVSSAGGLAMDATGALYVASLVGNKVSKITLPAISDVVGNAVTNLPYNTGETYTYDPNDAPTDITLSNASAVQPAGSGSTIGTLSTTDADLADTHTYTLVSGSGSTQNSSFVILGNSFNVGTSPLAAGSYSVRIQSDDGQGGTYAKAFAISVVDDVIPQIASIARKTPATQMTINSTAVFEVTFSEAVTGVGTSWFAVTPVNGSTITANVVSVTGGPTVYQVTVAVIAGLGDFRLDVLAPSAPADFGASLSSPWGLVFDGGGNLYVANNSTNQVSKVAADGTMTTYATAFSSPRGVAFDGAGNLYVANSSNSRVIKVATNGTKTNFVTGVSTPRGLAFDGAGNLYVSSYSGNTVSKVTSAGTKTTFASGLSGPTGLAFDSAGDLYVANYTGNTVIRVKPDGTKSTFATGFNNPEALAFDATGNLYVANYTGGTLVKVAGKGLVSTVATGLTSPTGLAFDSAGRLYVAINGGNKLIRVSLPTIDDLAGNPLSGLPYASGETYTYYLNNAPTDIALSHNAVNESGGANAVLGALTTTDADAGDSHSYTLVSGTGDTDNASFNLSGSTLRANNTATLAAGSYSVRIETNDGNGGTYAKAFVIVVVDNRPPVVTTANISVSGASGPGGAFKVGDTVTATWNNTAGGDNNADALSVTFDFTQFGGGAAIAATNSSGTWTAVYTIGAGFDAVGNHSVSVTVTDNASNVTTTTTNENLAPVNSVPGAQSLPQDSSLVFNSAHNNLISISDGDVGGASMRVALTVTHGTLTLNGVSGLSFSVGSGTADTATTFTGTLANLNAALGGLIYTPAAGYFGSASIQITTSDLGNTGSGGAKTDTDSVNLTINSTNLPPSDIGLSAHSVNRTEGLDGTVGTLTSTDVDSVSFTYSLVSGAGATDNGSFNISGDTLRINDASMLAGGTYSIRIRSTDDLGASFEKVFKITVVDEATAWTISASADFNGDGQADILWSNTVTGDRAVWLMKGHTVVTNSFLGTVPLNWEVSTTGDFNGDGKADIFWTDTTTGDRAIWLMNGDTVAEGGFVGTVALEWRPNRTGDFNGDGKADVLWTNTTTGERAIWLMNGVTLSGGSSTLGLVPLAWEVSETDDFDGDGKADILWTNTATGDRAMWLMNGTSVTANKFVSTIPVNWVVSGSGDFNGDGKADILWTDITTGDRAIWLMDGSKIGSADYLGSVPVAWVIINTTVDSDHDGNADILWSNTVTGKQSVWFMNGTTIKGGE